RARDGGSVCHAPTRRPCLLGDHFPATLRALAATALMKSTILGPQREATSSLTPTTPPFRTAAIEPHPGLAATLTGVCRQHFVSARTMRSGSAATMYSAESFGYPEPLLSALSAMSRSPSNFSASPPNVFEVAE